jgi:hypothetical protein
MKMPENGLRFGIQWISDRREIRTLVENRICERCGNQLKTQQISGREVVANILCGALFLAVVIPGCYFITNWIDRMPRLMHSLVWHEPREDWSLP